MLTSNYTVLGRTYIVVMLLTVTLIHIFAVEDVARHPRGKLDCDDDSSDVS